MVSVLVIPLLLTSCLATSHLNTLVKGGKQLNSIKRINSAIITTDSLLVINVKDKFYRKDVDYCVSLKNDSLQFIFNNDGGLLKQNLYYHLVFKEKIKVNRKEELSVVDRYRYNQPLNIERVNYTKWDTFRIISFYSNPGNYLSIIDTSSKYRECIFISDIQKEKIIYRTHYLGGTYDTSFDISDEIFYYEGSKKHIWKYPFYVAFDIVTFPVMLFLFVKDGGNWR